jgi:hypothetical protein
VTGRLAEPADEQTPFETVTESWRGDAVPAEKVTVGVPAPAVIVPFVIVQA